MHRITFSLTFFSCFCYCQTPPAHVVIGGGLLGKLDGFCETSTSLASPESTSCPAGRSPFGGLYGLQQEVQKARGANGYVLLTGNNLPKDFNANATYPPGSFIGQFTSFGADVTALGQDDLLRAVFPASLPNPIAPPSRFTAPVQSFLQRKDIRFLASNAAIRTHKTGLNKTWFKGYELMISADQSIPWTTAKLKFAVPNNHHTTVQVTLAGGGQSATTDCVDVTQGTGSVSAKLYPNTPYSLTVVDGSVSVHFEFHVDAALTPWDTNPGEMQGLPVASILHPGASPLLVVSLIDPAMLDILDLSRWKDKDGDGAVSLVLYPPAETAKFLLARAGTTGAVPVLLSDLNDALAAQVASSSADWALVSFNSDSHLLGCQSGEKGCAKGRSGDYRSGAVSILNGSRVWARPEWIGETLIEITASPSAGGGWRNITVSWREVFGGRFTPARNEPIRIQGKMFQPPPALAMYFAVPNTTGKRIWWSSRDDMAVVLMDAMRKSLKTDLAMADQRVIDPEVLAELNAMANNDPPLITTIGPQQLLEILWRHDPYTVIKITGKDLVNALGKLARLPADEDSGGICVRGLGGQQFQQSCSLPDIVKSSVLEINARYFNPDEYYSVALPQGLARSAGLAYPRNYMVNVFNTVLQYVSTLSPEALDRISPVNHETDACKDRQKAVPVVALPNSSFLPAEQARAAGTTPPPQSTLPLKWPNLLEKKVQSLIFMPPASIELAEQNYHVPNRNDKPDTSGFAAIPLVGEKAQHTFKLNMVGELHVVPIDLPSISLDIVSRVDLNRLETFPNSPTGFVQFAYTPDQWTNGAALRSKILTDALTKITSAFGRRLIPVDKRPPLRFQPFVGYFDDTSVYHYTATYSRKSDSAIFQESDAKPNYAYFGMGVEISPILIGKYFSVNNTRLEQDFGMNYASPQGVNIGGTFFNMEDVRRCGIQSLIDGSPGCAAAAEGSREVRYAYATRSQSRRQFLTSLVFALGPDNKKETFTLDIKANQWGEARTPLDPVRTAEFTFKSSFPIGAGIAFGPYFRYLTVNAVGSDGNFTSWRYGFTLTIPLTGKTGHGRFFF